MPIDKDGYFFWEMPTTEDCHHFRENHCRKWESPFGTVYINDLDVVPKDEVWLVQDGITVGKILNIKPEMPDPGGRILHNKGGDTFIGPGDSLNDIRPTMSEADSDKMCAEIMEENCDKWDTPFGPVYILPSQLSPPNTVTLLQEGKVVGVLKILKSEVPDA